VNLAGFRPSQQKSAQVRFRCAVYSQLWAAVGSVLKLEVRGQHFKGSFPNGKFAENSNRLLCLARDRSGTRRSILEARLQRRRKLATHYQGKSIRSVFESCLVDGDIGDRSTAVKIVDTAVSKFGKIDVLINNAGVFIPKPFTELHHLKTSTH